MKRSGHSFLDLTALPAVGAWLLDPRPAWLFAEDGTAIFWANGAGVRFYGAASVRALMDQRFDPAAAMPSQIAAIKPGLRPGEPLLTLLRLATPGEPALCLAALIAIDDEEDAVLVTSMQPPQNVEPLIGRAIGLASAVAEDGVTAVVTRGDGRVLGASDSLGDLSGGADVLAELAAATATSGRRLLKRRMRFGTERRLVGTATVATPEGTFMLALIGPAEPADAAASTAHGQPERPETTAIPPSEAPAAAGESIVALAPPAEAQSNLEAMAPGTAFRFQPQSAPIRFAFQLDPAHRFTQVSPELATVVGPGPAGIVGRLWREVAVEHGFAAAEMVERALSRRDTWSGITVYWPVENASDRVPVDLAAMPVFTRTGTFEGFRGFGVCRADPRATPPDAATQPAAEAPGPVEAAPEPETPAELSNVVRLPSAAAHRDRSLTGNEQDAFRRIAEALRTLGPRRTAAPPPAQGSPAEPAPAGGASSGPPAAPGIPLRLLDRLPVAIIVFRDRSVLFANRPFLDRFGYADAVALGAAGGMEGLFSSPAAEGDTHRGVRLRAADGSVVPVEARLHVVPWADGPATMLSVRSEALRGPAEPPLLADQKAAMARIDELEAVLDTATDGVIVLDGEARIMSLNRSAEALFGVEATEVLGRPFPDLLAPESRRSALDYLEGLARNGVASVLNDGREVIGKVPAGGLIPLFMTMGRLAERGKFCAVLRDITQWKNAEEELVAARRAAEAANQQKSDFLAKISHEIRTPLNAVIGFSEVMLEERFGPIGSDRYREYLRDIKRSGAHLMSLINDLLDLSKIEAGKLELSFTAVPVNEIIQECVALMQPEANRKRVIIRTSLAAAVPKVVADERSFRQIVLNLLSNAVKFTLAGGQVIVSSALDGNGEVVVRIRDTGIGMSEKDLDTALKPFRQVATSNPNRPEGTGLGLPLTKALVEANRASFAIDSRPHEGTMVRITFPTTRVLPA